MDRRSSGRQRESFIMPSATVKNFPLAGTHGGTLFRLKLVNDCPEVFADDFNCPMSYLTGKPVNLTIRGERLVERVSLRRRYQF